MTPQEYFALDDSDFTTCYELIGGRVYAMSGGSVAHDTIAFNMRMALALHFKSGPCSVHGSDVHSLDIAIDVDEAYAGINFDDFFEAE